MASQVQVVVPSPLVQYQVYSCKWEKCQAELHNLEVLRRHIQSAHIPYTLRCKWRGCALKNQLLPSELVQHVEDNHMESIARKMGHGPSVPGSGGNDAGRVSPTTIPEFSQTTHKDSIVFPASAKSIRAFHRVHGNRTKYERAQEVFKAVQGMKERIGVGLDPGGCQLATPARNANLADDEGFYEVCPQTS